ncbi:MAG: hypothetical protein F6K05_12970 [Okeania sp. SIO1H2]|nr:hypothetical protein [Okeania sp. SIO1H2]
MFDYLGFALISLIGEGRRQETGDRRQDKWVLRGGRSGRFVRMIFLPNYAPKIRSFLSVKS